MQRTREKICIMRPMYSTQRRRKWGSAELGNVPVLPDLYYNEFVGKSCRQIFEEASKVGGIWYAAQGSIVFSPFNASGSSFTPPAETDRTDIKYLGSKIISRAFVTDSYHNAVYEYGNTSAAWYSTVTVSGAYLLRVIHVRRQAGALSVRLITAGTSTR